MVAMVCARYPLVVARVLPSRVVGIAVVSHVVVRFAHTPTGVVAQWTRMGEGNEDEKLRNATSSSLRLADSEGIHTISFPAISTGIFGYPIERCARIMLESVHQYCEGETKLQEIRFCLFDESARQVFESAAKRIFDQQ